MDDQGIGCMKGKDRAALRRQRIVDAARTLFVNNGFHATGVAQIAKLSGIAVGQLYRDFEAKEDIVAAIVDADCAGFMARESLHQALAIADKDAVRAWIRHFIHPPNKVDSESLFAEIIAEAARNHRIAAVFRRTHDDVRGNMLAALELLAPGDHHAHERRILADMVMSQSLGMMQHRLLQEVEDNDVLAAKMLAIVEREIAEMAQMPGEYRA